MKEYNEDDFLKIAGLQHFAFCRRQWALIHIEQQWQENLRTVEGQMNISVSRYIKDNITEEESI